MATPLARNGRAASSGSKESGHPSRHDTSSAEADSNGWRHPGPTGQTRNGTIRREATTASSASARLGLGHGPPRRRRSSARAANANSEACSQRERDRPPSHVQDSTQKESERSGMARHGERTTSSPGRASSAARAAAARASEASVSSTGRIVCGGGRPDVQGTISVLPIRSALLYILTGGVAGGVGAMLGIGGGVVLVPLLTLALHVPIRAAVAASLISVIATATASSTVNLDRGLVNMRLAMALEVATSIGGLGGGLAASLFTTQQLFLTFGATLATMGALMMLRSKRRNIIADTSVDPGRLGGRLQEDGTTYVYLVKRLPLALSASLVAGAVSGLLGIGGGTIKVPVLNTFCGVPIRVAAATSAFMIGVTAAASVFIYYARGDVVLPVAAAVALGALPGSVGGARLAQRVEARALKILMAVVLLLVGGRMAVEAL